MLQQMKNALSRWKEHKYALAILALGLVLLLLPAAGGGEQEAEPAGEDWAPGFDLETEEQRLEAAILALDGVEEAHVLLSLDATAERQLAQTADGPLVISDGQGEAAVELRCTYPEYRGAAVVWRGSGGSGTALDITQVTAAFTGLGSDKITVKSMGKQ